jgi:hypothetical protein
MPTVLRVGGFRFFFYSREGSESPSHSRRAGRELAKFWIQRVRLANSQGFRARDLSRLQPLVKEHEDMFLEAWREHLGA